MRIHPGGFRLVLAGPKVARLLPFMQQKGFVAEAFNKGSEALNRMRQAPCHLLLLELECGDVMGVDLARGAKQEGIAAAALLLEDPMKSGMIVSALARGVDSFVSIPPDEAVFLARVEGMLLAQWGLVVTQQQQALTDEVGRLRAELSAVSSKDAEFAAREAAAQRVHKELLGEAEQRLAAEQKKVKDLLREADVLREQLQTMHLVTGAKTGLSDEGDANDEQVDFLIDDAPPQKPQKPAAAPAKAPAGKPAPAAPSAKAPPAPAAAKPAPPPPAAKTAPPPPATKPAPAAQPAPAAAKPARAKPAPAAAKPPAPPKPSMDIDEFDRIPSTKVADFEESTQAVPTIVAASVKAAAKASPKTSPSMPVFPSDEQSLEDFSPGGGSFDGDDAHTMAMPADVAAAMISQARAKAPTGGSSAAANNAHTMAMSADVAASLIGQAKASAKAPAKASPKPIAGDDDGAFLDDLEAMPTAGKGFDDDDDASERTMAIPGDVARVLISERRAPKPAELEFQEKRPAAGLGRAPAVPKSAAFASNDDSTAPGGIDASQFDPKKIARKASPALDSQIVRDLTALPSADAEEVLFADDDS